MTPRTVPIICSRAPRHIVYVPAIYVVGFDEDGIEHEGFVCSFCGARVRVVA